MAPYSLSQPLSSVSFEEKMKFSASQSLSFARSKWFALPQTESQSVVWSIKPPDFSLKLYRSLSDPQKKDRNTHSNPVVLHNNETKRRTGVLLPKILHESYQRENPPKFITSYKPPDALESELMFVKTGKFPSGSYKNPKPHDFRQFGQLDPSQTSVQETPRKEWTPLNLQSPDGMRDSSFLSQPGLQNQLPTPGTDEEEEHTAHSWTVWRRNSQDHGKIDHDCLFLNSSLKMIFYMCMLDFTNMVYC
ncbi:putative uncharacterized protein C7orf78 homolog isoform X2 [Sparus aurata]|uniref:putative uncharacterized protein C7orf78 homolog isoform X2 n=1 Tax=Sparus aurata TaxID=8175 RepID=UPI0011C1C612|nr:uncharacterized protein LOC115568085 isoform X2 [Sparus aurata]